MRDVATVHWRALDREGDATCRLAQDVSILARRCARLRYPTCELCPLAQVYDAGRSMELVSYYSEQTGFAPQLCVHHPGFVTLYPGLWQGAVSDEAA